MGRQTHILEIHKTLDQNHQICKIKMIHDHLRISGRRSSVDFLSFPVRFSVAFMFFEGETSHLILIVELF